MFSHSSILKGAFEASGKILEGLFGMTLREDKSFSCEECLQSSSKTAGNTMGNNTSHPSGDRKIIRSNV